MNSFPFVAILIRKYKMFFFVDVDDDYDDDEDEGEAGFVDKSLGKYTVVL